MKQILPILVLCLTGCVHNAPVKPTPLVVPVLSTNFPLSAAAVVPPPHTQSVRTVSFRWPANASNYVWDVQVSSNLSSWVTTRSNCAWPPSDNGDLSTSPTNLSQFYRMFGHQ